VAPRFPCGIAGLFLSRWVGESGGFAGNRLWWFGSAVIGANGAIGGSRWFVFATALFVRLLLSMCAGHALPLLLSTLWELFGHASDIIVCSENG